MGVENNECIIATTWNDEVVETVKKWVAAFKNKSIKELFAFIPSMVNSKTTIILAPCGSKKGWSEDLVISNLRNSLIHILMKFNYDDGSSPVEWVEVGFGEFGQKVLRGNCKNCYSDAEYAE